MNVCKQDLLFSIPLQKKEASKGEKMPSEGRREDQTGSDLVSQLEELKEKLAKAEVGIEIHQLSMHVKVRNHA